MLRFFQDWNILFTLGVLTLKRRKRLSAHRQQYLSMNCPGTTTWCERWMNAHIVTSFPSLNSLCRSNPMLKCKKHLMTSNSCSFLALGGTNSHVINIYYLCGLFPLISAVFCFSFYYQKSVWSIKVDPLVRGQPVCPQIGDTCCILTSRRFPLPGILSSHPVHLILQITKDIFHFEFFFFLGGGVFHFEYTLTWHCCSWCLSSLFMSIISESS